VLYLLSKVIPVPMSSTYGVTVTSPGSLTTDGTSGTMSFFGPTQRRTSRWVQWRGRVYRHRIITAQ
jgi:hypothetical protein